MMNVSMVSLVIASLTEMREHACTVRVEVLLESMPPSMGVPYSYTTTVDPWLFTTVRVTVGNRLLFTPGNDGSRAIATPGLTATSSSHTGAWDPDNRTFTWYCPCSKSTIAPPGL